MNVVQNVAYPLKIRGFPRRERLMRALDALGRVGLEELADRRPITLSGGQQQRVALARALVFSPSALLLDEPLSALDATLRGEMREEILKVQRAAGVATLHVTHDQEEALALGDRVAVVIDGRLVQVATPQMLYDHPANATVAAFVGETNLWTGCVCAPGQVMLAEAPAEEVALRVDTRGFSVGEAVTIMVRPERIMLASHADGINTFAGKVSADCCLGPTRRIDVAIGAINMRLHTYKRGDFSAITVPPESIKLFKIG